MEIDLSSLDRRIFSRSMKEWIIGTVSCSMIWISEILLYLKFKEIKGEGKVKKDGTIF